MPKVQLQLFCGCDRVTRVLITWLLPYLEDFSHLALLREGAVVLYGQDDGHVGYDKCGTVNGFHHILEDRGRDGFLLKKPLITNENQ